VAVWRLEASQVVVGIIASLLFLLAHAIEAGAQVEGILALDL
jgi:uncharacterized protein YijF (DUF1287 family)